MPKSKGPVEAIATAEQEQQVLAGVALTVQQQQLADTEEAIDRLTAANVALEEGMRSQEERHGKVLGFLQGKFQDSCEKLNSLGKKFHDDRARNAEEYASQQAALAALRAKEAAELEAIQAEIARLQAKTAKCRQFESDQASLQLKLARLQQEYEQERSARQATSELRVKQASKSKNAMTVRMQTKIARSKQEATAEVASQLGPKEKEAIKANKRMTSELWWQGEGTQEVGARLDRASEANQSMKQRVAKAKVATEAVATVMRQLELEVVRLEDDLKQRHRAHQQKDENGNSSHAGNDKGWNQSQRGGSSPTGIERRIDRFDVGSKRADGGLKEDILTTEANAEALDSPLTAAENELRRAESLQDEWVVAILDATRDHLRVHGSSGGMPREHRREELGHENGSSQAYWPFVGSEPAFDSRTSRASLDSLSSRDAVMGKRLLIDIVQRLHQGQEHSWALSQSQSTFPSIWAK